MIKWPPKINLTDKFIVREVKHHNFLLCLCEAPYKYVAKSKIIDVFIDDELGKYVSIIEKILLNFYRLDKRIFIVIVLFPLSEAIETLKDKIALSTTQWYRWTLNVVTADQLTPYSKIMNYITSYSEHFRPRDRPELITERINALSLPNIAILNIETPVFADKYQVKKVNSLINSIDVKNTLLILPLNPIGFLKEPSLQVNASEIYIQLTKPKVRYIRDMNVKNIYLDIMEYHKVLTQNLDIHLFNEVLVPYFDIINRQFKIIYLHHDKVDFYDCLNDKCRVSSYLTVRFHRSPLTTIYRLGSFTIRHNIFLHGNILPKCLKSTSILYRGYVLYDSGSNSDLIICQKLTEKLISH